MMKIVSIFIARTARFFFKFGSSAYKIKYLRKKGAKVGKDCLILTDKFGTEPFLIEIGDHVVIATGTHLINHDGGVWILRKKYPDLNVFGKIIIGDNVFIGIGCILLLGTEIGENCIIGAGSVVRGKIPDNSVVMGNPAKIIMKRSFAEKFILKSKNRIDTKNLKKEKEKEVILEHFFPQEH